MPSEISNYIFVDDPTNDKIYAIKIVSGSYIDVVYKYANIKISEDDKKQTCTLSYSYRIISTPEAYDKQSLHADEDFKNHIGDILSDILENQEYKIGSHGE